MGKETFLAALLSLGKRARHPASCWVSSPHLAGFAVQTSQRQRPSISHRTPPRPQRSRGRGRFRGSGRVGRWRARHLCSYDPPMRPPVGYIAYLDEAGDDGLVRVKPADPDGASEWLVLSCVLIKASREAEVLPWLKSLISSFGRHQMTHLHFRQLRDEQKLVACQYISNLPVRIFTVASNKKNMRGYENRSAAMAKINATAWFYAWLVRIMTEKVSDYCSRKTIRDHKEIRTIRFEYASRGGVNTGDIAEYLRYLRDQDNLGMMHNNNHKPAWDVIDFSQIVTYPAKQRAGLQLADCVASSFFSGLEFTKEGTVRQDFAKILTDRMARSGKQRIYGYGFKVMPNYALTTVRPEQKRLLQHFLPL